MLINKQKCVAFSGHRTSKMIQKESPKNLLDQIFQQTYSTILDLYDRGYTTFLSGMADGFDLLAASAIIIAKNEYPEIELIAVIPYIGHGDNFSGHNLQQYLYVLENADQTITLGDNYDKTAFLRRNDFLLDHSSVLVCYYSGERDGTMYTYNRAILLGYPVFNLFDLF